MGHLVLFVPISSFLFITRLEPVSPVGNHMRFHESTTPVIIVGYPLAIIIETWPVPLRGRPQGGWRELHAEIYLRVKGFVSYPRHPEE